MDRDERAGSPEWKPPSTIPQRRRLLMSPSPEPVQQRRRLMMTPSPEPEVQAPTPLPQKPVSRQFLEKQAAQERPKVFEPIFPPPTVQPPPPEMTAKEEKMVSETYYGVPGKQPPLPVAARALHYRLKQKFKYPPSEKQIDVWLKKQKIVQEFKPQRKGGQVGAFIPPRAPAGVSPFFYQCSCDLLDYTNRPAFYNNRTYRYQLTFCDNLSRFLMARNIISKEADVVAVALASILDEIKRKYKGTQVKVIGFDAGKEFLGDVGRLLKDRNIEKRMTLPGSPWSNGLIERTHGAMKRISAMQIKIKGGNWASNLEDALKQKNLLLNNTLGCSSSEALLWSPEQVATFRKKILAQVKERSGRKFGGTDELQEGDKVRVKLARNLLSKVGGSAQGWTSSIYTIEKKVKSKNPVISAYYIVAGLNPLYRYSKADLQKVIPAEIEGIPDFAIPKKKATRETAFQNKIDEGSFTRSKLKEKQDRIDKRETRQSVAIAQKRAPPPKPKAKAKPKQKKKQAPAFEEDDLVTVTYPDGKYDAVVLTVSDKTIELYFESDNTIAILPERQYNLIKAKD